MDAAASPAAAVAPKPRQVLTPVRPPPGGKPARKLLMTAGTTVPPAYSRKSPVSACGALPEDYLREVEERMIRRLI